MSHLANDLMEYLQSWNGEDWTRGTFLEQELKIKCRFLGEILIFGGIFCRNFHFLVKFIFLAKFPIFCLFLAKFRLFGQNFAKINQKMG